MCILGGLKLDKSGKNYVTEINFCKTAKFWEDKQTIQNQSKYFRNMMNLACLDLYMVLTMVSFFYRFRLTFDFDTLTLALFAQFF